MFRKSLSIMAALSLIAAFGVPKVQAMPGLGFGVHGGAITGYNNQTLEQSIRSISSDLSDFKIHKDMTDLGIHLDMNTLQLIAFDIYGDYMWKTQNIGFESGGQRRDGDFRFADASITGDVKASLPLPLVMPYVGLGLGLHRNIYSSTIGDVTAILPSNQTRFAWDALAGLAINAPRLPVRPYAEWRYTSEESPHARVVGIQAARLHYESFLLGVTFK